MIYDCLSGQLNALGVTMAAMSSWHLHIVHVVVVHKVLAAILSGVTLCIIFVLFIWLLNEV